MLSTLTSTLVFNLFTNYIDNLMLEDNNIIIGTTRNSVSLGRELERANRGKSPKGRECQVTDQPESGVYC